MKPFLLIFLLIGCRCLAQLPEEELRTRIGTTLTMGKIDSSIYWGKQLVAAYSTVDDYLLLASLYEIKKDTAAANRQYRQALAIADTNKYKVLNVLAESALDRGNMNEAIALGRQSLEANPAQPEMNFLLGTIYQRSGQDENAQTFYRKAYQLDSSRVEYQQQIYLQEYGDNHMREALRILAKSLETPERIMAASENTVSIDSSQLRKMMALAGGYLETDQYEQAAHLLETLTTHNLGHDTTYFMLAEAYAGMQENQKAAGAYTSAIGMASEPRQIYFEKLSKLYEQMGEPQLAVNALVMGANKGIADLMAWTEDYTEAIDSISRLNESLGTAGEDERKNILYNLAPLYIFVKHQDFALQVLDELRKNSSPDERAEYLAALAEFQRGRPAIAEAILSQLVALRPKERDYRLLLLTTVFSQGKYEEFISLLQQAESDGIDANIPELSAMKLKSFVVLERPGISGQLKSRFK